MARIVYAQRWESFKRNDGNRSGRTTGIVQTERWESFRQNDGNRSDRTMGIVQAERWGSFRCNLRFIALLHQQSRMSSHKNKTTAGADMRLRNPQATLRSPAVMKIQPFGLLSIHKIENTLYSLLNTQYHVLNTKYPVLCTQYPIPNTKYQILNTYSLLSRILSPVVRAGR
jgi:hypothetical protein